MIKFNGERYPFISTESIHLIIWIKIGKFAEVYIGEERIQKSTEKNKITK